MTRQDDARLREVLLGQNSAVWRHLKSDIRIAARFLHTLGHRDVAAFEFTPQDRVWVLSYSRTPQENAALLQQLRRAGVAQIVYLSSSSVIVNRRTRCWEYPRVKAQAEALVRAMPQGRVLTVGLMHTDAEDLPAGRHIATSYADLADFMVAPDWRDDNGRARRLFGVVERPFHRPLERLAHRGYSAAQMACGPYPCLLRPVDLLLRAAGMRWYGYTCLSNRLWTQTTSS